jgi:hypothetical protein
MGRLTGAEPWRSTPYENFLVVAAVGFCKLRERISGVLAQFLRLIGALAVSLDSVQRHYATRGVQQSLAREEQVAQHAERKDLIGVLLDSR